jgi:hypothetical protein
LLATVELVELVVALVVMVPLVVTGRAAPSPHSLGLIRFNESHSLAPQLLEFGKFHSVVFIQ